MALIVGNGTLESLTVDGVPWTPFGGGASSQTVFEDALRSALDANRDLNWLNGDVTLTSPIILDVTSNKDSIGVRLNGATIRCDFNDPTAYGITYRIPHPPSPVGIVCKGPNMSDGTFKAISPAAGGIRLECRTNQSWIFGFSFRNLNCIGFDYAGLFFHGSVFEFQLVDYVPTSNEHGVVFRNCGPELDDPDYSDTDVGIISAVWIRGGTMRDHQNHPVLATASQPFREPRDFTVRDVYVVGNNGSLAFPAGFTEISGCGFENNLNAGITATSEGKIFCSRASTGGVQPYLLSTFLPASTAHTLYSCRIEGYGGFEGMMKYVQATGGPGKIKAVDCGDIASYDLAAGITLDALLGS